MTVIARYHSKYDGDKKGPQHEN